MADRYPASFKNVLGELAGYDGRSNSPTEKNLRVLKAELFDYQDLVNEGATESWEAFWEHMHQKEAFFWKYFCGRDCEVTIRDAQPMAARDSYPPSKLT